MKIALVQLNIEWEMKKVNYRNAEKYAEKASQEGCDIVVFPEMFTTGFSMNASSIAEDVHGETSSVLSVMAQKYNINIIAGYAVKSSDQDKAQNMAVAYNREGGLIAKYAKMHPFSYAKEDQHYAAGGKPVIFNIEGVSSSIFICYDLRFPEVFRSIAKAVQTIFVIANWPSTRKAHWEVLLRARAIENQCFVIGVNRTGKDANGIHYSGNSCIYDPSGNKICSGNKTDKFIVGEINPCNVLETRTAFPFLKDMQPSDFEIPYH